jgi:hypothetical protein
MHRRLAPALALLLAASLLTATTLRLGPSRARACATAWPEGATAPRIAGEEALIVWEPAAQREHFIRRANFEGVSGDFGFLVPTPGRPTLAEADDGVFAKLAEIYTYVPPPPQTLSRSRAAYGPIAASAVAPVQVLEETRVAGLDAAVLAATDAAALNRWLAAHRYPSRPGLTQWLARYVAQGYFVTAFRYAAAPGGQPVKSRAVRLTFTTQRPFYPYAEPADAPRHARRAFRLSVVAPARMDGLVGTRPWSAQTGYSGRPANLRAVLRGVVPDASLGAGPWLTTFDEPASQRGGDDLFFVRTRATRGVPPSIRTAMAP